MPHFLIKKEEIKQGSIELIDSDNLFHISKVLRAKQGESIKFIDEKGVIYYCTIESIEKKALKAKINSTEPCERFLKTKITLIQAILASDAQNLAIANATQTGVAEIQPVISDNVSVSKKSLEGKTDKWQKIAQENFKQCERREVPRVLDPIPLKTALSKFKKENVLIFSEKDINITLDAALSDINHEIAVVIGPEGGFSENEFTYFRENNFKLITLGKMIYKAPNAITAALSNIVSRIEND